MPFFIFSCVSQASCSAFRTSTSHLDLDSQASKPHTLPHLVEKCCNGHVVSVNSLVAKWRRSAESLLCLTPAPHPLLSVSSVYVPVVTTRGRDEAALLTFLNSYQKSGKEREGVSFLLSVSRVLSTFLESSTEDYSQTRCSCYCALALAPGLNLFPL